MTTILCKGKLIVKNNRRIQGLTLIVVSPLIAYFILAILLPHPQHVAYNDRDAPNIYSPDITALRDYADISINSSFQRFEEITKASLIALGRDERCWEGQNSWKVNDRYGYSCAKKSTRVYGLNSNDIRSDLLVIDEALKANGWKSYDDGFDYLISKYYD